MSRNTILKFLVVLPLLVLIAAVVAGTLSDSDGDDQRRARPAIGDEARDFSYPDLEGDMVRLSDYVGDKVVLLNIWATWCTACREELPTVQKLYESFADKGLEVLAVSIDAAGAEVIKPFMNELQLSFPALQDTAGTIQKLYGTTGVPETFVIDRRGRIAFVEIGAGDWTEPEKTALIRGLVEEKDPESI